jgi:pyrroline-5-carboxylate reductase
MKNKTTPNERIAFLGGGNMAEALVRGLRASGFSARTIDVAEPLAQRRRILERRYGIRTHASNHAAIINAAVIVLAIKPQAMIEVLDELRSVIHAGQLVVSIAAGVATDTISRRLAKRVRVVRVMPNTPCLLGAGMSVLVAGKGTPKRDVSRARRLFDPVGRTDVVDDEALLDAVTGLSGSGPAYVYRFAEALIAGGVRAGLPEDLAKTLTFQTLVGAAKMLAETGKTPRDLRAAVSSPGGTTLAGLARMDRGKLFETVRDGVAAATARSRELAKLAKRAR